MILFIIGFIPTIWSIKDNGNKLTKCGKWYIFFLCLGIFVSFYQKYQSDSELKNQSRENAILKESIDSLKCVSAEANKMLERIPVTSEIEAIFSKQFENLSEKEKKDIGEIRPKIIFDIQELKGNIIKISLQTPKVKKTKIDKIFFNIELPGTFKNFKLDYSDKVGNYKVQKRFKMGTGDSTLCEYLQFEIDDFYSYGYFSGSIYYNPTSLFCRKISCNQLLCQRTLYNFHDFISIYYNWTFKGTSIEERIAKNISELKFIRDDNLNLLETFSVIKISIKDALKCYPESEIVKYVKKNRPDPKDSITINNIIDETFKSYSLVTNDSIFNITKLKGFYKDMEDLMLMEEKRKFW